MTSASTPAAAADPAQVSGTERAVHGAGTLPELRAFLDAWAQERLGSAVADVRFRAGRIDAVWGVELQDGRAAGTGPSWCRYQKGPWPVPHDAMVDFRSTPNGFGWLDAFGQRAADQILDEREPEVVLGHADWYAGNTAVHNGRLVGVFDWELVADAEAVIAGFTASGYAASPTGGGGLSTPAEVAAFLQDYEQARAEPLTGRERRTAAAAAAWILAFNARWQVALIEHGLCDETTIDLVRNYQEEYLRLSWP